MSVKPLVLVIGLTLLLALGLSWAAGPRAAGPVPPVVPGTKAAPAPNAAKRPDRPPQVAGVVEQVQVEARAGQVVVKLLVRVRPPPAGRPAPTDHGLNYREGERVWVNARVPGTSIEQGGGPVAVGEFITAWHDGEQVQTDPPQHYAEYLVSEPAPQK